MIKITKQDFDGGFMLTMVEMYTLTCDSLAEILADHVDATRNCLFDLDKVTDPHQDRILNVWYAGYSGGHSDETGVPFLVGTINDGVIEFRCSLSSDPYRVDLPKREVPQ